MNSLTALEGRGGAAARDVPSEPPEDELLPRAQHRGGRGERCLALFGLSLKNENRRGKSAAEHLPDLNAHTLLEPRREPQLDPRQDGGEDREKNDDVIPLSPGRVRNHGRAEHAIQRLLDGTPAPADQEKADELGELLHRPDHQDLVDDLRKAFATDARCGVLGQPHRGPTRPHLRRGRHRAPGCSLYRSNTLTPNTGSGGRSLWLPAAATASAAPPVRDAEETGCGRLPVRPRGHGGLMDDGRIDCW